MKRFQFKLDPLLKIRRFEEQLKFLELAKVLGVIEKNQNDIETVNRQSTELLKNASDQSKQAGGFNIEYLRATHNYLMNLKIKKGNAQKVIESLREEMEKKHEIANKARVARRVLEKLRENRQVSHNYEVQKQDMLQIDEFNQNRK